MTGPSQIGRAVLLSTILCGLAAACSAQSRFANPAQFLVCDNGIGSFEGKLPSGSIFSGVTVSIRATQKNGFAVHSCQARLIWDGGEIHLGSGLAQADIDVMGADLGFGVPVVAFQIKASNTDPTIRYEIYSLDKAPKLLHTIIGQDYFSAADTRLDGTVEIWTTDSAAVNGFDSLPLRAFDVPPTAVLRFEDGKLLDVSSQFRSHFDNQIRALRSQLSDEQLSAFKASDGRLSGELLGAGAEPRGLLATKVKILEIIWAYLASGREQKAWDALSEMWPASDLDRVRAAIVAARKRGLCSQIEGVSRRTEPAAQLDSAGVYDYASTFGTFGMRSRRASEIADTSPQQILLRLPAPNNPEHWNDKENLHIIIDEAGKVRTARMAGGIMKDISDGLKDEPRDVPREQWIYLSAGWKFIPAYKDGHPVAFRCRLQALRNR